VRAELLRRLVPVAGANAVPVAGVFLAGWNGATALTLYWCENLLGSLLVLARLALHRRLTRKRGYERLQLGLQSDFEKRWGPEATRRRRAAAARAPVAAGRRRRPAAGAHAPAGVDAAAAVQPGSFVAELAAAACAATVVHGVLLWLVLRQSFAGLSQDAALRHGLLAVAAFQLLGFALDLPGLRERPFAWARELAQGAVARVTLVHLVLIAGFWVSARGGAAFFGPFAVLKAAADVGNLLARAGFRADPDEAPAWLAGVMNRLRTDADFAADWRERKEVERQLLARDEEVGGG
jgi:hypothetical protein